MGKYIMIKIKNLEEAIQMYVQYKQELNAADMKAISGDLSDGNLGYYVLRVENFPFYSINRNQISLPKEVQDEFILWEINSRKKLKL